MARREHAGEVGALLSGEARHLHIGNHGGTSEDEMMIPLILETT